MPSQFILLVLRADVERMGRFRSTLVAKLSARHDHLNIRTLLFPATAGASEGRWKSFVHKLNLRKPDGQRTNDEESRSLVAANHRVWGKRGEEWRKTEKKTDTLVFFARQSFASALTDEEDDGSTVKVGELVVR